MFDFVNNPELYYFIAGAAIAALLAVVIYEGLLVRTCVRFNAIDAENQELVLEVHRARTELVVAQAEIEELRELPLGYSLSVLNETFGPLTLVDSDHPLQDKLPFNVVDYVGNGSND